MTQKKNQNILNIYTQNNLYDYAISKFLLNR